MISSSYYWFCFDLLFVKHFEDYIYLLITVMMMISMINNYYLCHGKRHYVLMAVPRWEYWYASFLNNTPSQSVIDSVRVSWLMRPFSPPWFTIVEKWWNFSMVNIMPFFTCGCENLAGQVESCTDEVCWDIEIKLNYFKWGEGFFVFLFVAKGSFINCKPHTASFLAMG